MSGQREDIAVAAAAAAVGASAARCLLNALARTDVLEDRMLAKVLHAFNTAQRAASLAGSAVLVAATTRNAELAQAVESATGMSPHLQRRTLLEAAAVQAEGATAPALDGAMQVRLFGALPDADEMTTLAERLGHLCSAIEAALN